MRQVPKYLRDYFKTLSIEGWTGEVGAKAFKMRSPNGSLVSCSLTPSCPFTLKHVMADVKRAKKRELYGIK